MKKASDVYAEAFLQKRLKVVTVGWARIRLKNTSSVSVNNCYAKCEVVNLMTRSASAHGGHERRLQGTGVDCTLCRTGRCQPGEEERA